MVVKVHCGAIFGDKFAAMLKMRPPKESHNALFFFFALDNHLDPKFRATSKWPVARPRILKPLRLKPRTEMCKPRDHKPQFTVYLSFR